MTVGASVSAYTLIEFCCVNPVIVIISTDAPGPTPMSIKAYYVANLAAVYHK